MQELKERDEKMDKKWCSLMKKTVAENIAFNSS